MRNITLVGLVASLMLYGCSGGYEDPVESIAKAREHAEASEFMDAAIILKNAIGKSPEDVALRGLLGEVYFNIGKLVDAKKELEKYVELGGVAFESYKILARTYHYLGMHQEILNIYAKDMWSQEQIKSWKGLNVQALFSISKNSAAIETLSKIDGISNNLELQLADSMRQVVVGDLGPADDQLAVILEKSPQYDVVWWVRGNVALALHRFEDAEIYYRTAMSLREHYLVYGLSLARLLADRNKLDEAEVILKNIESFESNWIAVQRALSVVYTKKNDYENGFSYAQKVISVIEDDSVALNSYAVSAYSLGRLEQAYKAASRLAVINPNPEVDKLKTAIEIKLGLYEKALNTVASIELKDILEHDRQLVYVAGVTALNKASYTQGRDLFGKLVALSPDSYSYMGLASAEFALGNEEVGVARLHEAGEVLPNEPKAMLSFVLLSITQGQLELAASYAKKLQQAFPLSPEGYTAEGVVLQEQGDKQAAKQRYLAALDVAPGDPGASHNLALLLLEDGDLERAVKLYQEVLKRHRKHLPTHVRLYLAYFNQNDNDAAEKVLIDALAAIPNENLLRFLLARLYLIEDKPAKSRELLLTLKPVDSSNVDLWRTRGLAHMALNDFSAALSDFERLVNFDGQNQRDLFYYAEGLKALGRVANAAAVVDQVSDDLLPDGLVILQKAKIYFSAGQYGKALEALDKLRKQSRLDSSVIDELTGDILFRKGDFKAALSAYEAAFGAANNNISLVKLANTLSRLDQPEAASSRLSQWLKQYPDDHYTKKRLAGHWLQQGDFRGADRLLREAIKAAPDGLSYNNLAFALLQQGDTVEAMKSIEKALNLLPQNASVHDTHGMIAMVEKRFGDAISSFRYSLKIEPTNIQVRLHLAEALLAGMALGEAKQQFDIVVSSTGNERLRQQAMAQLEKL